MCTPALEVKLSKVVKIFSEDAEEEKPRDRLKVMNYITGNNKFIEDGVIARADDLYVAK
jgi:hypothetical protein